MCRAGVAVLVAAAYNRDCVSISFRVFHGSLDVFVAFRKRNEAREHVVAELARGRRIFHVTDIVEVLIDGVGSIWELKALEVLDRLHC